MIYHQFHFSLLSSIQSIPHLVEEERLRAAVSDVEKEEALQALETDAEVQQREAEILVRKALVHAG